MTLKELLALRGMKMIDLATAVGVDKATITRWSKSKIPADRVSEVERATGIPASALRPDLASVFGAAQ